MFETSRDRPKTDQDKREKVMSTKVTPRQEAHTKGLITKAFESANLDKEGHQRLARNGGTFTERLTLLIRRFGMRQDDGAAREILGDDYLSPEMIADTRGLAFAEKQMAMLGELPDEEALKWGLRNDCYLTAGSPCDMSLLDIREVERSYFYSKEGGWYNNESEKFARNDKVTCRWLMPRKGIVPNSTYKTWSEQEKLLSDLEVVPNVPETVWGVTAYKAVRDIYLLGGVYARTSSVDSYGYRVHVGHFGDDGLYVSDWGGSGRDGDVGVASSRK